MTTPVVLVAGTWGLDDSWWRAGSPLRVALEAKGLPVVTPDYKWTGEVGGTDIPRILYPPDPEEPWHDRKLTPWVIAGRALLAHCRAYAPGPVHLITHSHGLQVGIFACAFGLHVETFLSISGPIRADMAAPRAAARSNIRSWIQTFDPDPAGDPIIRAGELGAGGRPHALELPEGDLSLPMPGHGHSGLLTAMTAWSHCHLYDYLLGAPILPGVRTDAPLETPAPGSVIA